MKKYLLILLAVTFLTLSAFLLKTAVFAQFLPSFEVYRTRTPDCGTDAHWDLNCTSYPTVTNVHAFPAGPNYIFITLHAADVSGIEPNGSVIVKIQNPAHPLDTDLDHYIYTGTMHDTGFYPEPNALALDGWYATDDIDVSGAIWQNTVNYPVDIFAMDRLHNDSGTDYVNITSFTISGASLPSDAQITSFGFTNSLVTGVINQTDPATITLSVPSSTNLANLVAIFTPSPGATVKIGSTIQVSGTTPNDFTNGKTYTVTSLDGTNTKDYTVTVEHGCATAANGARICISVLPMQHEDNETITVTENGGTATGTSNSFSFMSGH